MLGDWPKGEFEQLLCIGEEMSLALSIVIGDGGSLCNNHSSWYSWKVSRV